MLLAFFERDRVPRASGTALMGEHTGHSIMILTTQPTRRMRDKPDTGASAMNEAPGIGFWLALVAGILGAIVLTLVVLFTVSPIGIFSAHNKRMARRYALLSSGRRGTATILAVKDTGRRQSSGDTAVLTYRLRVDATPQAAAFEADSTVPVPEIRIHEFNRGKTVHVKFDASTQEVAMELDTPRSH